MMQYEENNDESALAGTTGSPAPVPVSPDPREVFPISFEKDYMDFRPVSEEQEELDERIPKGSTAPVSAATLKSVTGLEDVSSDDLESSAPTSAEKGSVPTLTPVHGTPTSSQAS
jgi:hypothetical protein